MTSKGLIIAFAGLVIVLGAWSVCASKGIPWHRSQQQRQERRKPRNNPQQEEPEGDPADWTRDEMKAWLQNRGESTDENVETRVMLLARIQEMRD